MSGLVGLGVQNPHQPILVRNRETLQDVTVVYNLQFISEHDTLDRNILGAFLRGGGLDPDLARQTAEQLARDLRVTAAELMEM